jgi:hypothetical protein
MDLATMLLGAESQVLDEAQATLQRSNAHHYEAAGDLFTRDRLADLFKLVVQAIRDRDLGPVGAFSDQVAVERFNAGFDVSEVQAAFNALEVAMWRHVVSGGSDVDLVEAVGLLSTVLGFGKDTLARQYVSLASKRHVTSLDMSALFRGTNS